MESTSGAKLGWSSQGSVAVRHMNQSVRVHDAGAASGVENVLECACLPQGLWLQTAYMPTATLESENFYQPLFAG